MKFFNKSLYLWLLILPVSLFAQEKESTETIFDRKVTVVDSIMTVPMVARYEERLGIKGRYELVGDVNLWVEVVGEGTPLVLISGGPGTSHHYFHPHFQQVSTYSEVVYYDMRGVGLSDRNPGPSGYNIEQSVDDLEGLRKKLGYDRWAVLGLSFGGIIAQYYAYKYPERTLGMILLSAVLPASIDVGMGSRQYDYISEEEIERIGQIYNIGGARVPPVHSEMVDPELQRQMLFNAFYNGDWKRRHLKRWTVEDMAMYARYEFVQDKNYYHAMFKDYFEYDFKDVFRESPIPAMIIEGKWDLAFSADKASLMFDQFPQSRHVFLEDSGHLPFEDEPQKFNDAIRSFIISLKPVPNSEIAKWSGSIQTIQIRKKNNVQLPPSLRSQ